MSQHPDRDLCESADRYITARMTETDDNGFIMMFPTQRQIDERTIRARHRGCNPTTCPNGKCNMTGECVELMIALDRATNGIIRAEVAQ